MVELVEPAFVIDVAFTVAFGESLAVVTSYLLLLRLSVVQLGVFSNVLDESGV